MGDLTEDFLRYRIGGPIFGGSYTWRGIFSEFYGIYIKSSGALKKDGFNNRPFARWRHFTTTTTTGKNNRFPLSDILGYFKNTHKNPKFGRLRQVPTRELGWDLSHFAKFGSFVGIL